MPATSLVSMFNISNNAVDPYKATTGDIITITITFNAPATSISGTINTLPLTLVQQGSTAVYKALYTVQRGDLQDVASISITADAIPPVTAATDLHTIFIDTFAPTATITYVSSNLLFYPKVGDIHTLTLVSSEVLLKSPRLNFGHLQSTKVDSKTTNIVPTFKWTQLDTFTWIATYTLTGQESFPKSYLINLVDLAGNISVITFTFYPIKPLDFKTSYYFFDHFNDLGEYGFIASNDAGNASQTSPKLKAESGVMQLQVSTPISWASYNISSTFNTFCNEAWEEWWLTVLVSDLADFTGIDNPIIRIGIIDSNSEEPNYGLYFESDPIGNTWQTCIAVNGTRTKNNIASIYNFVKVGGAVARKFLIHYVNGNALFTIDDVLIDTIPYAINDPITVAAFPSPGVLIKKNLGAGSSFVNLDYLEFYGKNPPAQEGFDYNDDYGTDYSS